MTRSEAIERLAAFADKHGKAALARKLGCSRSFALLLLNNDRNIGDPKIMRNACEQFRIPYRVWEEKVA